MARINENSVGADYERELDLVGAEMTVARNAAGRRVVFLNANGIDAGAQGELLHEVFNEALEQLRSALGRQLARVPSIDIEKLYAGVPLASSTTETLLDAPEVFGDGEVA